MAVNIDNSLNTIKSGLVLLHKTDTIWGLACDATNVDAINKIKTIKNRPDDKAFIILISDISQLSIYVEKVPDIAWDLVEFAEKPLTVVYPKGKNLPKELLAQDGSVAIRLVKDEHCKNLIYRFGKAIASTSANISGDKSPEKFEDIDEKIIKSADFVEKLTEREFVNNPSTIVKLGLGGEYTVIRK